MMETGPQLLKSKKAKRDGPKVSNIDVPRKGVIIFFSLELLNNWFMIYWASALLSMKGYSTLLLVSLLKWQDIVKYMNVILKPQSVKRKSLFQNANANLV